MTKFETPGNSRLQHFDRNLEDGRGKGEPGEVAKGVARTIGMVRIDGLMQREEWMRLKMLEFQKKAMIRIKACRRGFAPSPHQGRWPWTLSAGEVNADAFTSRKLRFAVR
ncbi:MAG: hypothetical protein GX442_01920 [Candidatus Riflebacteria bacterium]|nr:hypothetical protein [Candidatus Riflebacteria bacterium]